MSTNPISFDEFKTIVLNIEHTLYLPYELKISNENEQNGSLEFEKTKNDRNNLYKVLYDIVSQPLQLQCGCIISKKIRLQYYENDQIFNFLQQQGLNSFNDENQNMNIFEEKNIYTTKLNFENHKDICPICFKFTDLINGKSVKPLIQLYNQLQFLKTNYSFAKSNETELEDIKSDELRLQKVVKYRQKIIENNYNNLFIESKSNVDVQKSSTKRNQKPQSLLHLFQSISMEIKNDIEETEVQTRKPVESTLSDNNTDKALLLEEEKQELIYTKTTDKDGQRGKQEMLSHFEFNVPILNTFDNKNISDDKTSCSNKSNQSITATIQNAKSSLLNHNTTSSKKKGYSVEVTEDDENKEIFYSKCFPMYRKRSQFNVHSKFFTTKAKLFINTDISSDCTKFVLLSEHKWEVFEIFENFDQKKNQQPFKMMCCGKINGDYGKSFNDMIKAENIETLIPDESYRIMSTNSQKKKNKYVDNNKVNDWDHLFCKLMNNLLIIAGTKGILRIIDLEQNGKILKTLKYSFPIRCLDVNSLKNQIACGITGKERTTGSEQALIVFQKVEIPDKNEFIKNTKFPPPVTITLPYRDPINTLQFSDDGMYLSCSTCFENRFLLISLKKIDEPRLIMKSIRNIDNSLESEGITSTHLFPGNAGLMCVTSVAYNSPPIILDTKIKTIRKNNTRENAKSLNKLNPNSISTTPQNGNKTLTKDSKTAVLQPSMLLRLDELGSKIYKCEISPRNDSIVFLDKHGTIYLMASSTNSFDENNEKRRVLILENISNAYKLREAACMKFNKNGHKLYLLDRKGIFYIEDFAAGLPQDNFVTKCKQIN
ncbi:hypothetical protein ACO0SA_001778 [Hanseniaspora valbyensis]